MVSPGTDIVKNHESQSITNESQFTKKDGVLNWKYLGLYSVCTQTNKLETDANTLYYSLLKLKSSPSVYSKHKKESNKYIYIFKQQPQKSHEQDILPLETNQTNLLHLVVHWVITAIKADNFVWCKALPAATQI